MNARLFFSIFVLISILFELRADEPSTFEQAAAARPEALQLTEAAEPVWGTVEFDAIEPKVGYGIVLRFNARMVTDTYGGWNPYMTFRLNGKTLDKRGENGQYRLLRRGTFMATSSKHGDISWWNNGSIGPALMTFFAPMGTERLDDRILNARQEGFTYWLDVTDLVNERKIGADNRIESNEPNRLEVGYALIDSMTKSKGIVLDLHDITLLYISKDELSQMAGSRCEPLVPGEIAEKIDTDRFSVAVRQGGGLTVETGGESFFLESFYSYPAQPVMKYNRLGVESADGWTANVTKPDENTLVVAAEGNGLKIERTLTNRGEKIAVVDLLTNVSGEDSATRWRSVFSMSQPAKNGYRLAGQFGADRVNGFGTKNPTIFIRGENASVGVVVEDDISRQQLVLDSANNEPSFGSAGRGLALGETARIEWTLYPSVGGDYFDFVNQVRRDWNVNRTIPGPMAFRVDKKMADFGCHIKIAGIPPWHRYAEGMDKSDEEFKEIVTKKIAETRRLFPDIILLGMVETNLVPFDASPYDWKDMLPLTYGDRNHPKSYYGLFASKEATEKIDAVSPLADSILRDANGCAMLDTYYVYTYSKKPFVNLMVQPEEGNQRFKDMLGQVDFLMDECGFDGIYFDQFQPSPRDGFSDNRWDGFTVDLADDGTIAKKRYSYAITGATARAAILRRVAEKGGVTLTNGQTSTRAEREAGILSFQEMENDPVNPLQYMDGKPPECRWQSVSHLGTPIVLGFRPVRIESASAKPSHWPEIINKAIITALRNGVVYYYYQTELLPNGQTPPEGSYDLCHLMFPFTPRELHEGWVYGDERLVTAISGTFTVHGENRPNVCRFDRRGVPVTENLPTVSGESGRWTVDVKLDDWNETAVIVVR